MYQPVSRNQVVEILPRGKCKTHFLGHKVALLNQIHWNRGPFSDLISFWTNTKASQNRSSGNFITETPFNEIKRRKQLVSSSIEWLFACKKCQVFTLNFSQKISDWKLCLTKPRGLFGSTTTDVNKIISC